MTTYQADSKSSVLDFADKVCDLNEQQLRWFLASVLNAGLIQLSEQEQKELDEQMEQSRTMLDAIGVSEEDIMMIVFRMIPMTDVQYGADQFINHLVGGTDKTSDKSVGGFNQNELTLATAILEYAQTVS